MHVPPKNLRLESQCAPQQTPDEFVRDSGVARVPHEWDCDADECGDGFSREALINL
jgi:hypothetical protein